MRKRQGGRQRDEIEWKVRGRGTEMEDVRMCLAPDMRVGCVVFDVDTGFVALGAELGGIVLDEGAPEMAQ